MKHKSPIRHSIEISLKPAGRPEGAVLSISRPESTTAKKRTFVEDFNMEHSFSGVTVTLVAVSAGSDPRETGSPRRALAD